MNVVGQCERVILCVVRQNISFELKITLLFSFLECTKMDNPILKRRPPRQRPVDSTSFDKECPKEIPGLKSPCNFKQNFKGRQ